MFISFVIIFCIASVHCDKLADSSQKMLESPLPISGCKDKGAAPLVRSCDEVLECGIYTIMIDGIEKQVYCQVAVSGMKFTVIQRRNDFGEPANLFFKGWMAYKLGFGDLTRSFWIGNDALHNLTATARELHIDMEDFEGVKVTVIAKGFQVAHEKKGYQLSMTSVSPYLLGKSLWFHRGMKFSTKDKDQDDTDRIDCANLCKGGWWYRSCHVSNLNGMYLKGKHESFCDGVNYFFFRGSRYSLKRVEMKIRMR